MTLIDKLRALDGYDISSLSTLRNLWPLVVDALEAGEDLKLYTRLSRPTPGGKLCIQAFDTAMTAIQEVVEHAESE